MKEEHYKVNTERILFTNLDDEGVIFDIEKNTYFNLNPTFCLIFSLLTEGRSVEEVKTQLMVDYNVNEEICESSLTESIQTLIQKGFISPV
jgi:hypothetical protein